MKKPDEWFTSSKAGCILFKICCYTLTGKTKAGLESNSSAFENNP